MVIKESIHKINANTPKLPEGNYLKGRIGFWAIVSAVNSLNNTVTVISDTGYELENIPVISREWVTVNDDKDYIPSERNLPPVKSRVFVLTPTYTATGAFVLCSGFSRGDENIRTLWAQDEDELEDKNNIREIKTQGGWDITEEYSNGNFKAVSNDGEITLTANTTENSDKEQNKELSISAWGNTITINEDGISISDANENKIEATSSGVKITDKNKNVINMTSSNIQVIADSSKKIKIANGTTSLQSLLSDLISKLNSGTVATEGSSSAQTVVAGQFAAEVTKLGQILE